MLARSSTLGLLATMALSLPTDRAPGYSIQSSGAARVSAAGKEASYGLTRQTVNEKPTLTISLGAAGAEGRLGLYTDGQELPRSGRYPIHFSWQGDSGSASARWFHACFVAGTPEHPLGVFHGQSGWVTISDTEGGLISGEFEIRAQGFLAANTKDESQWVTVYGTFTAEGDSTVAKVSTVRR
jgi:hypothetical protein